METSVELEKLLTDIRKNISDNRLFVEKIMDESIVPDSPDTVFDPETAPEEEEFEEL